MAAIFDMMATEYLIALAAVLASCHSSVCPVPNSNQKSCPAAPANPKDRRNSSSTVSIALWNTEFLFDGDGERTSNPWHDDPEGAYKHMQDVAGIISELDADIVAIMEVEHCHMFSCMQSFVSPDYIPYLVQGKDSGTGQDVALLSKIDPTTDLFRDDRRASFPLPNSLCTTSPGDSGVSKHLVAEFSLPGVGSVSIIAAHLKAFPTNKAACAQREAQALVLQNITRIQIEKGHEVIVLGDINDYDDSIPDIVAHAPISSVLAILKNPMGDSSVQLSSVMSKVPQSSRFSAYWDKNGNDEDNGDQERSAIDHFLVSPKLYSYISEVRFRNDLFVADSISDHWPIYVAFDFSAPTTGGPNLNVTPPAANGSSVVMPWSWGYLALMCVLGTLLFC